MIRAQAGGTRAAPSAVRRDPGGFTLLEVLVAFAIALLGLALLTRVGLEGMLGARLAERTQEAVSRAKSRLAACHNAVLAPGETGGDDGGGYRWSARVDRDDTMLVRPSDDGVPSPAARADLLTVEVTVSWSGPARSRAVTLTTKCVTSGAADRP